MDNVDDATLRAAMEHLTKDRPLVMLAYRGLRDYIRAAERGTDLHSGHFAEAMSWLIGEITAAGCEPADWPAAFDLWRTMMTKAAEQQQKHKEAREAAKH